MLLRFHRLASLERCPQPRQERSSRKTLAPLHLVRLALQGTCPDYFTAGTYTRSAATSCAFVTSVCTRMR